MGDAKRIKVKPISSKDGNRIIKALHYSGKVVQNSQLHLGVFMDGKCGGALSFGPSLDKRNMLGIVEGTGWNEYIELNRMALADWLPRNGESRVLSVSMRLLKKHYPQLKWVISFADATQCGDGTIYRAAGFILTALRANKDLVKMPDGNVLHKIVLQAGNKTAVADKRRYGHNGGESANEVIRRHGGKVIPGYQLRYIYFLDPSYRARLTVPEIPYSEIQLRGAGMYKGKPRGVGSIDSDAPVQPDEGGASPTPTLQTK